MNELREQVSGDAYVVDTMAVAEALLHRLDLRADPPVPRPLSPRGARVRPPRPDGPQRPGA